jgi:hypothetical protein
MNNDLTIITLVDTLGDIDARIKALTEQSKQIKDQIKDLATLPDGKKIYVGTKYAVEVTSRTNRAFDYAKLEAETSLTKAALDAYKTILSTTIVASSSPLE